MNFQNQEEADRVHRLEQITLGELEGLLATEAKRLRALSAPIALPAQDVMASLVGVWEELTYPARTIELRADGTLAFLYGKNPVWMPAQENQQLRIEVTMLRPTGDDYRDGEEEYTESVTGEFIRLPDGRLGILLLDGWRRSPSMVYVKSTRPREIGHH